MRLSYDFWSTFLARRILIVLRNILNYNVYVQDKLLSTII